MARRTSRLVSYGINESVIAGWTLRVDGLGQRYLRALTREVVFQSKLTAPRRSGNLANSIDDRFRWANQYGAGRTVNATAPYARYVHEGTGGKGRKIWAKRSRGPGGQFSGGRGWLPVGKSQGKITHYAHSVSGQDANPFIMQALLGVMARKGLLTP